jgi:PAS domain S-box-containing protein
VPGAKDSPQQELTGGPSSRTEYLSGLAVESLPSGVLIVDSNGAIVLVNRQIEQQFGYRREELIGQTVDVLVPVAVRPGHATDRHDFQRNPEERPMGAGRSPRGQRRDGSTFPVEIRLNPIRTADGAFLLASVVDVTARTEMEEATQRASERQLEVERLIGELSFGFINLPSDQVLAAIRDALRRVGTTLEVDR